MSNLSSEQIKRCDQIIEDFKDILKTRKRLVDEKDLTLDLKLYCIKKKDSGYDLLEAGPYTIQTHTGICYSNINSALSYLCRKRFDTDDIIVWDDNFIISYELVEI